MVGGLLTSPFDGTIILSIIDLTGASQTIGTYTITAGVTTLPLFANMPTVSGVYILCAEQSGVVVSRIRVVIQ